MKETAGIINAIKIYSIADIKMPKVIDVYRDGHFLYERLALQFSEIEFLF